MFDSHIMHPWWHLRGDQLAVPPQGGAWRQDQPRCWAGCGLVPFTLVEKGSDAHSTTPCDEYKMGASPPTCMPLVINVVTDMYRNETSWELFHSTGGQGGKGGKGSSSSDLGNFNASPMITIIRDGSSPQLASSELRSLLPSTSNFIGKDIHGELSRQHINAATGGGGLVTYAYGVTWMGSDKTSYALLLALEGIVG